MSVDITPDAEKSTTVSVLRMAAGLYDRLAAAEEQIDRLVGLITTQQDAIKKAQEHIVAVERDRDVAREAARLENTLRVREIDARKVAERKLRELRRKPRSKK